MTKGPVNGPASGPVNGPASGSTIELAPVAPPDRPVLARLLQLYLYDFSAWRPQDITAQGTFGYRYFDAYFTEPSREACLIRVGGALAGFTMTRELPDGEREMSEFFVLRGHRRHGTGRLAALHTLRRHPGRWVLDFDHANHVAARFWPQVAAEATESAGGTVSREDHYPPAVAHAVACLRFSVAPPAG